MKRLLVVAVLAVVLLAVPHSAQALIFFDDFNRTVGSAVGNGWTVSSTNGDALIDNLNLNLSPVGKPVVRIRALDRDNMTTMSRSVSTAGYTNIGLSYYRNTTHLGPDTLDFFEVSWKPSSSGTWNVLDTGKNADWTFSSFALPASASEASIDLRFHVFNEKSNKGRLYLDNVTVDGELVQTSNAIPEPATMLLLGSGLLGAAYTRKKRI